MHSCIFQSFWLCWPSYARNKITGSSRFACCRSFRRTLLLNSTHRKIKIAKHIHNHQRKSNQCVFPCSSSCRLVFSPTLTKKMKFISADYWTLRLEDCRTKFIPSTILPDHTLPRRLQDHVDLEAGGLLPDTPPNADSGIVVSPSITNASASSGRVACTALPSISLMS